MEAVLILGLVFVLYEVLRLQGQLAAGSPSVASQSAGVNLGSTGQIQLPAYTDVAATDTGVGAGASSAISANIAALNFIPVVGPALSAVASLIAGGLMKASAQRAHQAASENAAVAAAVPGWDKGVAQVVAAYNQGQISAGEVQQFIMSPNCGGQGMLWQMFWKEVGPQIQPGRNQCQSGSVAQNKSGKSYCGPAGQGYGASCCVGYDSLDNSSTAILSALAQAEAHPGTAVSATTVPVFAWKYGGINRPAYKVTFQKPAPATAASSFFGL
jgi:hypothetical protein